MKMQEVLKGLTIVPTDDRDSDASTDFKIFAASLFRASTRERCAFSTRDLVLKIATHAKEMAQANRGDIDFFLCTSEFAHFQILRTFLLKLQKKKR